MGHAIRKGVNIPTTEELIQRAEEQQKQLLELRAKKNVVIPPDEADIDDLLGPDPQSVPRTRSSKPREQKSTAVLRVRTHIGRMVAFMTQKGEQIVAPGTEYYVVRFNGRLHYKVAADCVLLPDSWKEGDPIPGLTVVDELL